MSEPLVSTPDESAEPEEEGFVEEAASEEEEVAEDPWAGLSEEDLRAKVAEMASSVDELTRARDGILGDLRRERSTHAQKLDEVKQEFSTKFDEFKQLIQPPEEKDPRPDPELETGAFLEWQARQTEAQLQALREEMTSGRQAGVELLEREKKKQAVTAMEQQFVQQSGMDPNDYLGKLGALRSHMVNLNIAKGMDEQTAELAFAKEQQEIVEGWLKMGLNPAEQAMAMYDRLAGGGQVKMAPKAQATPGVVQSVQQSTRAGGAPKSRGGVSSGINLKTLATMDFDEWSRTMDKLSDKQKEKIKMGGTVPSA